MMTKSTTISYHNVAKVLLLLTPISSELSKQVLAGAEGLSPLLMMMWFLLFFVASSSSL